MKKLLKDGPLYLGVLLFAAALGTLIGFLLFLVAYNVWVVFTHIWKEIVL